MRARSGAIHSDSQQNFAKLAEVSLNHNGIFYDGKTHRRAMARLPHSQSTRTLSQIRNNDPVPSAKGQTNNVFSQFDFNIEFEGIRQEREELERMKLLCRKQINVGILSSDPRGTVQHLRVSLGLAESKEAPRDVDLVVGVADNTIYKYWVFGSDAAVGEDKILAIYLSRCRVVLDVREGDHLVKVVRCTLDGWDTLSESILTPLKC